MDKCRPPRSTSEATASVPESMALAVRARLPVLTAITAFPTASRQFNKMAYRAVRWKGDALNLLT